jgi:predicted nucleotidyltransferase
MEQFIANESINTALNMYVDYISSLEGVLQIYLFGSFAYGTSHEQSDIDLMVVVEDSLNTTKTSINIQKGLSNRAVPLDILVNRKSNFYAATNEPTMQRRIQSEGILLYAK